MDRLRSSAEKNQSAPDTKDGVLLPDALHRTAEADFDDMAMKVAEDWPTKSVVKVFRQQVVAAEVPQCAEVGNAMLDAGGSAADAVIAAALCAGVMHPHSSGLGGGAFTLCYERDKKAAYTIDAREVAPALATRDMYHNVDDNVISPKFGWHSIAVPGELAGMWELHQRSGKLPWKDLFQPAIKRAREGFGVTPFSARMLAYCKKHLVPKYADSHMRRIVMKDGNGDTYVEGDIITMPTLADTLEVIANDPEGTYEFYHGSIAEKLITDIQAGGGILDLTDLADYQAHVRDPISSKLADELTLFGFPPPVGSAILHHIFSIMEGYSYDQPWSSLSEDDKVLFYHRFVEALKYGYASQSRLGDDLFVPEVQQLVKDLLSVSRSAATRKMILDKKTCNDPEQYGAEKSEVLHQDGTAQISAIDKDGNAAVYSTSINAISVQYSRFSDSLLHLQRACDVPIRENFIGVPASASRDSFGSFRMSKSTGIILNNQMDDFKTGDGPNDSAVPPSHPNKIEARKRPQSSMCPVIITDRNGDVKIVAGGSGGSRIISGLMSVLTRILFFGQDIKSAFDAPRLHHQLIPMTLEYEKSFDKTHIEELRKKGHKSEESKAPYNYDFSAIEVILVDKKKNEIYAVSDGRKGGLPYGV